MTKTTAHLLTIEDTTYIRGEEARRLADAWVDETDTTRAWGSAGEAPDEVMYFAEAHPNGIEISHAWYIDEAEAYRVDAFPFTIDAAPPLPRSLSGLDQPLLEFHVGIKATAFPRLEAHPDLPWFVEGDGFADWGEQVGTSVNDDDTYHVTLEAFSVRDGLEALRTMFTDDDLVRSGDAYGTGHECPEHWASGRVAVSIANDWSDQVLNLDSIQNVNL